MQKKCLKNEAGFSLVEIITALSIFIVVITVSSSIFQHVIIGQRKAIAGQNGQESIRYIFEIVSKELRMAKRFTSECATQLGAAGATDRVYNLNGGADTIYFKNKDDECVRYYVDGNNDFKVQRVNENGTNNVEGIMTPEKVTVSDINFEVVDSPDYSLMPKITVRIEFELDSGSAVETVDMQTTVSARYYTES